MKRRSFIGLVLAAVGISGLPKSKAVAKAEPFGVGSVYRSQMAVTTEDSATVVLDTVSDMLQPGMYVAGDNIPAFSQIIHVYSGRVFQINQSCNKSSHDLIGIAEDPGSAAIDLRMEQAGQATRELMANALFRKS